VIDTELPSPRFAVHGLALELHCGVDALRPHIARFLAPFTVPEWPEGFYPIYGNIQPFDAAAVQRSISSSAVPLAADDQLIELYQDGDRFWVVDDRWGMAELNLVKRQWRSWLLPRLSTDALRCVEMSVLWPLAQLLRCKGLHLIPAVSIARGGWGGLILCPFGIEPELNVLLRNGYRIVGQRWTVLREEDGRIAMLNMPGVVDALTVPHLSALGQKSNQGGGDLLDLTLEFPGSGLNHTFCDTVIIVEPGRRTFTQLRPLNIAAALPRLRRSWPIIDLQPQRHANQLPPKLARQCQCVELQLCRDASELLSLLDKLRGAVTSPVQLSLYVQRRVAV
jgi:hypothetical protein